MQKSISMTFGFAGVRLLGFRVAVLGLQVLFGVSEDILLFFFFKVHPALKECSLPECEMQQGLLLGVSIVSSILQSLH